MAIRILIFSIFLCLSLFIKADPSANVNLTNDYVWRGISQTLEDPAIQGGFDWSFNNGFSFGVWGSNVDFVENGLDDGADLEVDLYMSMEVASGENWSTSIGFIRYIYPGTEPGIEYDWNEYSVSLSFYETWDFSFNYSNDTIGSDEEGTYITLSKSWSINEFDLSVAVSNYQLEDSVFTESSYSTFTLSAGKTFDNIAVNVSYYINDSNAEDIFGDIGESRLAVNLSASF